MNSIDRLCLPAFRKISRCPGCRLLLVGGLLLATLVSLLAVPPATHGQQAIGKEAFRRVWDRQDGPVADGIATDRSWTWGPAPISAVLSEPMQESPGGMREVQYFDKSRMEINDPTADENTLWYVTNGLLPIELMTGRIQVGFDRFEETTPARISAIGDPGTYPTYADMAQYYENPGSGDAADLGQPVTQLCQPDGSMGVLDTFVHDPATVLRPGDNGHAVPQGFLDFQRSSGVIYRGGQAVQAQVYEPDFVFGKPVTPACWVASRVGGNEQMVLFQVFERRVLTYNPANSPAFRVEMGNVGQHFYRWRYEGGADEPIGSGATPTRSAATATPLSDEATTATPTDTPTADEAATATPTDTPTPTPVPTDAPTATPAPSPTATSSAPPPSSGSSSGFFGMNTYITGQERIKNDGPEGVNTLVRLGREAGVQWAREELSWANMEGAKKGVWAWGHYDEHLLKLSEAGYEIMGVLMTTPGWARVGDCASREGVTADYWCPPASAQDFADFTAAIVERYDGDGVDDAPGSPRVAAWQIWNEPSTPDTWPGTPAEYGAILVAGYNAAKAADPSAVVATGGFYLYDGMGTDPNDGLPFLNEAIAAVPEAVNAFDALAIHPYMPTSAPDAPVIFATITLWGRITTAQNWLQEHAVGGVVRPLWISEVGWSTCTEGDAGCFADVAMTEQQQADYLVRTYVLALAKGVEHVNYFQLEDKFDGATGRFWAQASVLGEGSDYRQKPAYTAYRVLSTHLSGTSYVGPGPLNTFRYNPNVENPVDVYDLRFALPGGALVDVIWRNAGTQTLQFSLEPGFVGEVITRDGQVSAVSSSPVTLEVGEQPVYVRQWAQ